MRAYVTAAGMALVWWLHGRSWCRSALELSLTRLTGARDMVKGHVARTVSGERDAGNEQAMIETESLR